MQGEGAAADSSRQQEALALPDPIVILSLVARRGIFNIIHKFSIFSSSVR